MFHNDKRGFTSADVDQQIEHYLSSLSTAPEEQAAQRTIQRLQRVYQVKSDEYAPSLQRVWQRVQASEAQEAAEHEQEGTQQSNLTPMSRPDRQRKSSRRVYKPLSRLAQLAAILCLALIVGSFATVSHFAALQSLHGTAMSGLYAYQNNMIYRLDSQNHTVLWKHAFAKSETVLSRYDYMLDEKPFVVRGILYVQTQVWGGPQYYLYALSTANGSVLWRQSSIRVLASSTAVYTQVESSISNTSTLTAHDLRTGKQLWQHQYLIVGSKNDLGRGTTDTEGFRLVAVTDQLLYAVASYSQNGQTMFARYGLNPKNGSIIWQNKEVIAGRMPTVAAKIVDGVIYTVEYNLKPVPPHIEADGATVEYAALSHAVAYDAATGKRRWQKEMVDAEPEGDFSLAVSGEMLYFQTFTGSPSNVINTLHALSTSDGASRWQYQMKGGIMTSAVLEGNSLYFETDQVGKTQEPDLNVVALDARTGDVRWSTAVKFLDGTEKTPTPKPHEIDPGFSSAIGIDMAPVASQDTVYYSTPGNRVYALRSSDGKILQQFWVDKTNQTTVQDRAVLFVAP